MSSNGTEMMPPSFVIHSTLQMFAELQLIRTFRAPGIEICTWWIISNFSHLFNVYYVPEGMSLLSIDCHIETIQWLYEMGK